MASWLPLFIAKRIAAVWSVIASSLYFHNILLPNRNNPGSYIIFIFDKPLPSEGRLIASRMGYSPTL